MQDPNAPSPRMTLPEIREAEAPPGTAEVFAGLRAGVGVAQVNLIWRHAAALPGVLDWLWAQARPALESGAAAGARDRIAARVPLRPMPHLDAPPEVAGLDGGGEYTFVLRDLCHQACGDLLQRLPAHRAPPRAGWLGWTTYTEKCATFPRGR